METMFTHEYFELLLAKGSAVFINYSPRVLAALIIIVVGLKIAKWVSILISKAALRKADHTTSVRFIKDLVYYSLFVLVMITALTQVGVSTASFIAVFGAMSLAISLAFRDSLSNFASGVSIIITRPISLGDFITIGGEIGTVSKVGISHTTIMSPDNKKIVVPNSAINGGNVYNFTANPKRRVDIVFQISYNDDVKVARAAIIALAAADERVLDDPAPMLVVTKLTETGVELSARMWCNTADYWQIFWDMSERIKEEIQAAGLSIPVPKLVRMV